MERVWNIDGTFAYVHTRSTHVPRRNRNTIAPFGVTPLMGDLGIRSQPREGRFTYSVDFCVLKTQKFKRLLHLGLIVISQTLGIARNPVKKMLAEVRAIANPLRYRQRLDLRQPMRRLSQGCRFIARAHPQTRAGLSRLSAHH